MPVYIKLRIGEVYVLTLEGLGVAGYTWQYSINGPENVVSVSIEPASEASQVDQESALLPGASRNELATIRALQPGHVIIDFAQRRPWEQKEHPLKERHLEVSVES